MIQLKPTSELPLFVCQGKQHNDIFVGIFSIYDINMPPLENAIFQGIHVCSCCGDVEAVFELTASDRADKVGTVYTKISADEFDEFAGCKTDIEYKRVAGSIIKNLKKKA